VERPARKHSRHCIIIASITLQAYIQSSFQLHAQEQQERHRDLTQVTHWSLWIVLRSQLASPRSSYTAFSRPCSPEAPVSGEQERGKGTRMRVKTRIKPRNEVVPQDGSALVTRRQAASDLRRTAAGEPRPAQARSDTS